MNFAFVLTLQTSEQRYKICTELTDKRRNRRKEIEGGGERGGERESRGRERGDVSVTQKAEEEREKAGKEGREKEGREKEGEKDETKDNDEL